MPSFFSAILTFTLLLSCAGAKADVYSKVNQQVNAGQWAEAQAQVDQHLKSKPTDPQMRLLLSRIQDGQGQTDSALRTLQTLTLEFPELPEPHNNMAVLLARQNRYAEALAALQAAIAARPDYATALENLGDVHVALAIQAYGSAMRSTVPQPRAGRKRLAAEQLLNVSAP